MAKATVTILDAVGAQRNIEVDADSADLSQVLQLKRADTAARTNKAVSTSAVELLAANEERKGAIVYNESTQYLLIAYGSGASLTSFTYELGPNEAWEMPPIVFTGQITGIWRAADASGNARVTELT